METLSSGETSETSCSRVLQTYFVVCIPSEIKSICFSYLCKNDGAFYLLSFSFLRQASSEESIHIQTGMSVIVVHSFFTILLIYFNFCWIQ